jgi:hypothetical protein
MQDNRRLVQSNAIVDSLRKSQGEGIRAHGKLKGMDVFSWMQPDQQALANFMTAMPSSILWVANPAEIEAVLTDHPEILNKFQCILSYGENRTGFMLENEFEDIQEVLNALMPELKSMGTLLFTCTENDSEYVSLKISAYLNLVQLI